MKKLLCCIVFFVPFWALGQQDSSKWLPPPPLYYSFIDYDINTIAHPGKLDTVFKKLARIKIQKKGRVNIIHIGDSHLQADLMTSVVRSGLQDYFGSLGRGILFPYQLAASNAPHDFTVSSNTQWKSARLGIEKSVKTGICGFGIQAGKENATIKLNLKDVDDKPQFFNRLVFFLGPDSSYYSITDAALRRTVLLHSKEGADTPSIVFDADSLITGFELAKSDVPGNGAFSFYGVSLERRDTCGVLYHTIGVNGARFDHYTESALFWKQLHALNGDLFILSLGTNEAQNPTVNEAKLMATCDSMVKNIKRIAPRAIVMFTTPAGSYFKQKKPNPNVQKVSAIIAKYCDEHDLPCWDLNKVTDGAEGAAAFKKYNMLSRDLVHYTGIGYQEQGLLLLNAFADAYNVYYKKHPVKTKPKVVYEYIEHGSKRSGR